MSFGQKTFQIRSFLLTYLVKNLMALYGWFYVPHEYLEAWPKCAQSVNKMLWSSMRTMHVDILHYRSLQEKAKLNHVLRWRAFPLVVKSFAKRTCPKYFIIEASERLENWWKGFKRKIIQNQRYNVCSNGPDTFRLREVRRLWLRIRNRNQCRLQLQSLVGSNLPYWC